MIWTFLDTLFRKSTWRALCVTLPIILSGCSGGGNGSKEVSDKTFGMTLRILNGNSQSGAPGRLLAIPLTVQVVGLDNQLISGATIEFVEVSSPDTDLYITVASTTTSASGTASTEVRTPSQENISAKVRARIVGTPLWVDFDLSSSVQLPGTRFDLTTTTGSITIPAGQSFGFIVTLVNGTDGSILDYDGPLDTIWNVVTQESWNRNQPQNVPVNYTCVFVDGVCNTATDIVLVDARQPTVVYMGDGNDGYIDVFAYGISIAAQAPVAMAIADLPGGPSGGATTIADIVLTADSTVQNYSAAFIDVAGNYISAATAGVAWSSDKSEINSQLSPLTGLSTSFTPLQTVPFPDFGRIFANLAGWPQAQTGKITVDPGVPVTALAQPKDGNYTRLGGEPFEVDIKIKDAKGNLVGQSIDKPTGFSGGTIVNMAFSNFQSGITIAGGSVPTFGGTHVSAVDGGTYADRNTGGASHSFFHTFFAGDGNDFPSARVTFFDATVVNPVITVSIAASTSWPEVIGSVTYSMAVGPENHLMFRTLPNSSGIPVCLARYNTGDNRYDTLDALIEEVTSSYTSNPDCEFLDYRAGDPATTLYTVVEDKGGNFIRTGTASLTGSGAFTTAFSPSFGSTFSFGGLVAGSGGVKLTGEGFTNSMFGSGRAADPASYNVSGGAANSSGVYNNIGTATSSFTVSVSSIDLYGNCIVGAFTNVQGQFSYTAQTYLNSPNGAVAPILPDTSMNLKFFSAATPQSCSAHNITVQIPNTSNSPVAFTFTDINGVTGGVTISVIPGPVTAIQLRDSLIEPSNLLNNLPLSISTNQTKTIFLKGVDAIGNSVSNPVGTWTLNNMNPSNAMDYTPTGSSSFLEPQKVGTANSIDITYIESSSSTLYASTGAVTINPGPLSYIEIEGTTASVVAGVPFPVTLRLKDAKDNDLVNFTGLKPLSFQVLNNSPTRLLVDQVKPADGSYMFVNGVLTGLNFTLYNASAFPRIQVVTTSAPVVVGQSAPMLVTHDGLDHLYVRSQNTQIQAGLSNQYTIKAEDVWGNVIDTGADASLPIRFNMISAALTTRDVTSTSLANFSPASLAGPTDYIVEGELTSGVATVDMTSTKAGLLQIDATSLGTAINLANNVEEDLTVLPLSTVTTLQWKTGSTPPASHTASAVNPILPFTAQLIDPYGNVIFTNNTDPITVSVTGTNNFYSGTPSKAVTAGEALFNDLRYTTAETVTLTAYYDPNPTIFATRVMNVFPSGSLRTVVVLPSQTWINGTGDLITARTGDAFGPGDNNTDAGSTFTVTVRLTDDAYNTLTSFSGITVSLASATDPYLQTDAPSKSFTNGVVTFDVTTKRRGTHTIEAYTGLTPNRDPSTSFTVDPLAPTQLLAVLPGQTLDEGAPNLAAAIAGTATNQTAGSGFSTRVVAVDNYYNQNPSYSTGSISLTTSDANDTHPGAAAMAGGETYFTVTNVTATAGQTVAPSGGGLASRTSETYQIVAGSASQCIAVLPGQTLVPGKSTYVTAVTGSATDRTAGTSFNVSTYAVDPYFNINLSYAGTVALSTPSDPTDNAPSGPANFAAGAATFLVDPVTAANTQSANLTCTGLTVNTPATYNVIPGAKAYLITLFTDYQTFNPGQQTLAAAITPQTSSNRNAGTAFNIKVIGTDNRFNKVVDTTLVSPSSSEANYSLDSTSKNLVSGEVTFSLTNYRSGTSYTAQATGAGYSSQLSSTYDVLSGAASRLLVLTPGSTFSPGKLTASNAAAGTPYKQTTAYDYTVQVIVTDDFYNQITGDNSTSVTVAPSGGAWTISSSNPATVSGGSASFTAQHSGAIASFAIDPTAAGLTGDQSKPFQVLAALNDPAISLADPNTAQTDYIRQTSVNPNISNDATGTYWCVSETQSTRPSSGTNSRLTCSGGAGTNIGWHTARPNPVATSAGQGTKTFYVWVADAANNVSLNSASGSIILDSVLPATPTISVTDPITSSTTFTKSTSPDLSITGDTDATAWCVIEQASAAGAPATPAFNNVCFVGVKPTSVNLTAEGSRKVYVFTRDTAMNISSAGVSNTITRDTINPADFSITGAYGNTDAVADAWLGTTTTPTLSWVAAVDATTVTYAVTISDAGMTPVCTGSTTGLSYAFGCTLTNGQSYTVDIVATDQATNSIVSSSSGFSFTVDTIAPSAFAITGATGGTDVTANEFLTNGTIVTANWVDSVDEDSYRTTILNSNDTIKCSAQTPGQDSVSISFGGCALTNAVAYKIKAEALDLAGNVRLASNNPFIFTVSTAASNFLVEMVTPAVQTAGTAIAMRITARKPDLTTDTSYAGFKTLTTTGSTPGNGTAECNAAGLTPTYPASWGFTTGVATDNVTLKKAESNVTLAFTQGTITGSLGSITVTAGAGNCVRIGNGPTGAATLFGATVQNLSVDGSMTAYALSFDAFGNFIGNISANWSGTGVVVDLPIGISGTSTKVTGVKSGIGTLTASGSSDAVNISIGTGNVTWTSATQDADSRYLLAGNSIQGVKAWDVGSDTNVAWRTAGTQSWYSESFATRRGARAEFPKQVFLFYSPLGLDIVDSTSNRLFMRFDAGAGYAIDSALGQITSVVGLNGKVYVGMSNGAGSGGLIIIDFENDQIFQIQNTSKLGTLNISQRNSAATYNVDATYPAIVNQEVRDLSARHIGSDDYLAIGYSASVALMRTTGTTSAYSDTSIASAVQAVALSSDSRLYYSEVGVGVHRANLTLPLGANFSSTYTYTTSTPGELSSLTTNDISVAESTSGSNHTLLVASDHGLSSIQENFSNNTLATARTYSYIGGGRNISGFSRAIGFDGSSYMSAAGAGATTTTLTSEFWFRPSTTLTIGSGNKVLFQRGDGTTDGSYGVSFDSTTGKIDFWLRHVGTTYTTSSTATSWTGGNWYHLAAIASGATGMRLYIDGTQVSTNAVNLSAFDASDSTIYFGGNGTTYFTGAMDMLRISSSARYTGASFTVPTTQFSNDGSTVALYNFNDTGGSTATATTGNNGTLNGEAWFTLPMLAGTSEQIYRVHASGSAGSAVGEIFSDKGWSEVSGLNATSPAVLDSLTGLFLGGDVFQVDSITDRDIVFVLQSTSGVRLQRR